MTQEQSSVANVFLDDPNGVRVHYQIVAGTTVDEVMALAFVADSLIGEQLNGGYKAAAMQARGGSQRPAPASSQQPTPIRQSAGPSGVPEWHAQPDGSFECSVHGPGKWIKPGVSKNTGKPYDGFWACTDRNCKPQMVG